MNKETEFMMNEAMALLKKHRAVTLTHKSGRVETIGYDALQREAPAFLEGAFVESVICHDPIITVKGGRADGSENP